MNRVNKFIIFLKLNKNNLLFLVLAFILFSLTTACAPDPIIIYKSDLIERVKLEHPKTPEKPEVWLDVLKADGDDSNILCYSSDDYNKLHKWIIDLEQDNLLLKTLLEIYELEIDQHNAKVEKNKLEQEQKKEAQ